MRRKFLERFQRPADRLVFPLDVPDRNSALLSVEALSGLVGFFKVGLALFIAEGPSFLKTLRKVAPDCGIFLDLKLHDIPATISQAMVAVNSYGVELVTVHAQGGEAMLKSAALEASPNTVVLGVTLLTSLDPANLGELAESYARPGEYAALLAQRALSSGCGGLVCSPLEVPYFRARFGSEPLLVTPGIRPKWSQVNEDDQKRTGGITEALQAGADLLVIGRPIRNADSPAEAAAKCLEEIRLFLNQKNSSL
ncbi:MAG: orotidine-5'-phosphate decarboxylase [Deltaproteobacteria bacterium]|jgi:orotidine-5'-phosphate decarboxylase|nr:orotidine-5'-phosphate decarboxylase [Deltaproteobacteria bacterium]